MIVQLRERQRPAGSSPRGRTTRGRRLRLAPLTERQLAVLRCAAEGRSTRETAAFLGISDQTAKNHLSHVLAALRVDDRTAAVVIALQHGWLDLHALSVGCRTPRAPAGRRAAGLLAA